MPALTVTLQLPEPSAVLAPTSTPPTYRYTVALASAAVPLKVAVASSVLLAGSELPVSQSAAMSGVVGAAGSLGSIVPDKPLEAVPSLPARSTPRAVKE